MDSFGAASSLEVGETRYDIFRIDKVPGSGDLPFCHKVLLENLLRTEDGANVTADHIGALGSWDPELVIDHSVIADVFGRPDALELNVDLEYQRNRERYQFLRWGQTAFDEFKVVPPGTGIVHQVNIESLARVVMVRGGQAYPPISC